ncbi:MAG: TIGR03984 family CRISPR-associated protein [Candidatus Marinimicrobia bacterium]|nr:TIGR03984 family CRISPR-associated protein [Candidatus Neomarinimicrobiota bacterium]
MYQYKEKFKTSVPIKSNHDLKSFEELAEVTKENLGDALAIFYFDFGIRWAKFEKGEFVFHKNESLEIQYLQEARIFTEKKEMFLRRNTKDNFFCRLRVDEEGQETDVIETHQLLLGKTSGFEGGFTLFKEESGSIGWVPGEFRSKKIAIKTINYIDYSDGMLAGFVDSRFVKIEEI